MVGMMALIYLYAQSGTMNTKMQNSVLCMEEKKENAANNLSDRCKAILHEGEKGMNKTQLSLQETSDGYELILYDRENQEVFSLVYPKEPWVKEVSEGVLEIGISVGSPASYTFYFREEDGKISETFSNAKVFGEKYIAHRSWVSGQWNDSLILSDIFEEGILYQEIYRDFSVTADPMSAIYSIELIDEDHVMLEYCVGEDYAIVNEVVEIENAKSGRE